MTTFREHSRTIHDDKRGIRVGEVTVQAPDGTIFQSRYLHTPDVVAIVAVHNDDLLLLSEFRPAVGTEVVQVPMGKLPPGRDPATHAREELAEETGFHADRCEPAGTMLACPGWMDQLVHVFLATDLIELATRPESDDPDDVAERLSTLVRMPVTEFDVAVKTGVVRDARTIAAVRLALG